MILPFSGRATCKSNFYYSGSGDNRPGSQTQYDHRDRLVKFRGNEILDEWSSLVNPGRKLPFVITQLTGITDRELIGKPRLAVFWLRCRALLEHRLLLPTTLALTWAFSARPA